MGHFNVVKDRATPEISTPSIVIKAFVLYVASPPKVASKISRGLTTFVHQFKTSLSTLVTGVVGSLVP
ncbi:hypothetical protein [uncultured Mediterranean phage]|nr:hypothetical protein [uncultured Mediterranean phage]